MKTLSLQRLRKLPILLFPLMASVVGAAQEAPKTALKFNLLSPVDLFTFPAPQLALERMVGSRVSLSLEGGYQLYDFRRMDTTITPSTGFKTSFEIRLYDLAWKNPKRKVYPPLEGWYAGIKMLYWQNEYTAGVGYSRVNTGTSHWDNFGVRRTQYGGQILFGFQEALSSRMLIDIYTGLGMVKKDIRNWDREVNYLSDSLTGTDMVPYFASRHMSEESRRRAIFSLGFRMGYRF